MKLEHFLYEWLTNFFHFMPGTDLEKAIKDYVYQGKDAGSLYPDPWSLPCGTFKEECDKGIEFFLKNNIDKSKTFTP